MPRPLSINEAFRKLLAHDNRFQVLARRGKGSEVIFFHPNINGRSESIPVTHHKGRDLRIGMLLAILRRFNLPKDFFNR